MTLISQNLAEISVILSFTNPFCSKNLPGLGAHKLLQQRWFSRRSKFCILVDLDKTLKYRLVRASEGDPKLK